MQALTNKNLNQPSISDQRNPIVTNPAEMHKLKLSVLWQLYKIALHKTGNPVSAAKLLKEMKKKYRKVFGEILLTKAARVGNRYYWRLAAPGFPSEASQILHKNEVNRFIPGEKNYGMRTVIIGITKKCFMNCEHCAEWDNLHKKDTWSSDDIVQIVKKYQEYGTTQVLFSGGEPMLKIKEIYGALDSAKSGTDFWILTSGTGLDFENAKKLKEKGLTGVMVSLDHYIPLKNDKFRGYDGAYNIAVNAITNANKAGLVTNLSICPTKNFTTRKNLDSYMKLARKLGVAFVQFMEPRAEGRYAGENVALTEAHHVILDSVYLEYNSLDEYKDFPIVNYIGYHQRRVGCYGAGDRFFYIDTDGYAHICPFCRGKKVDAKVRSAGEVVNILSENPCHLFEKGIC